MIDLNTYEDRYVDDRWSLREWINASKTSDKFDSFKVYCIEIYDDTERFIKIGRTFQKVSDRFYFKKRLPYNYNILFEISSNPYRIFNLETKLKKLFKEFKYVPKIEFNGMYECFNISHKDKILEYYELNYRDIN